jgi:hypothetical protein
MTTAPQLFDRDDAQNHRLMAFEDSIRHFPGVRSVDSDFDAETVTVRFDGHKSAVPMPMRDVAKALCIELPAPGNQRYADSDDFEHGYRGPGYRTDHPETVVTFRLGGAMAANQR